MTIDQVWKTSATLADGREIIYFDETPDSGRAEVADTRTLMTSPGPDAEGDGQGGANAGELRWDPLLREWVAFAEQRQGRTFLPSTAQCPLCPSGPGRATEIPAYNYDVVVFQNRFPALPAGHGRCEVVCFTADHNASFATLSPRRATTIFAAWADRTAVLGRADGIEHVYCFENRGEEVGVTLHHPHGQVYALPFVPPHTQRLLASARDHRARTGGNMFDWLVETEIANGRRLVARTDHWAAFVPAAAHWPYEVLLFPVQRVPDLASVTGPAVTAFAEVYLDVLGRLDRLFGVPMPYMACWQQAPSRDAAARAEFALHLQVMTVRRAPGKLKFRAGTESGADVWSNDVLPERAASMLRDVG